jgi:hypothetical protein
MIDDEELRYLLSYPGTILPMVVPRSRGHCNLRLTVSLFNDSVSIIEISIRSNLLGESCLLFEGNRKIDQTDSGKSLSGPIFKTHLQYTAVI